MNEILKAFRTARTIAAFKARRCTDCSDAIVASVIEADIPIHGLAVPYDTPTGDGRMIAKDALTWNVEDEGIPIIWDREDSDHDGVTLGKVDVLRADEAGVHVDAARLFATDNPEDAALVSRLVELLGENALGWSVMLDDEEVEVTMSEQMQPVENDDGSITIRMSRRDEMSTVVSARIRHLAIVDTPAFPGARPVLGEAPVNAAVAAVATYPAAHFEKWESREPVPLQVTADGRVFGHAAGDECYRTGSVQSNVCRKYSPDPDPKMRNFHTGTATLDDGSVIRVGPVTAASLHATPVGSIEAQRRHHEDTSTVFAKAIAWNDDYGRLCVSGSIVPGLDPAFVAQAAGAPISVELWPAPKIAGLTLAGLHLVNSPAWPVAASV